MDDSNRADYSKRGMGPFRPYADRPQLSMAYYEVPADGLEDPAELVSWARRSVAVAMAVERPTSVGRSAPRRRTVPKQRRKP